jgi:hypothetical protein
MEEAIQGRIKINKPQKEEEEPKQQAPPHHSQI